jgi:hypothetical protein
MSDFGVQVDECTGASLAELHDNAFVATSYVGRKPNGLNCASLTTYASATDADGAFGGTNDFVVAPSCTGACAPIVCANATDCASKVFQAWDAATFGSANATSTAGYRLAPGLTCTLAQRTYALPSGATTDVYGAARTSPYSVGAAELDSACMP